MKITKQKLSPKKMKTQMNRTLKTLVLGSLLACPISSQARVVQDINSAMTRLLGHAPAVTNVYEADLQGLNQGAPPSRPWSSSYWPDLTGGIANHYRDRAFLPNLVTYLLKYNASSKRFQNDFKNVCEKYETWSPDEINQHMSPTEKYDLLLGDTNFTFTKAVIADIDFRANYKKTSVMNSGSEASQEDQFDGDVNSGMFSDNNSTYAQFDEKVAYKYWKKKGGSLAYWFGICDGWSPAAVTLPRPENPVTVTGALGHEITFYPDDLKALGSYLFARTNNDYMTTMNYNFVGRPCASGGDPELNDNGIVKDFRCNDVDAGMWHLALLNRIGKDKMGFVFEVDNNKKINNHPVSSYSLTYFNPVTGAEGSLNQSVVPRSSVKDAYAGRRHPTVLIDPTDPSKGSRFLPDAVYLVGVKSNFRYMNYQFSEKHHGDKWVNDSEKQDEFKDKVYTYDLELDVDGNILGGEWGDRSKETTTDENGESKLQAVYSDQPDFIWMAAPKNLPYSEMSPYTTLGTLIDPSNPRPFGNMKWSWDGQGAMPADWLSAAKQDEMWKAPTPGETVAVGDSKSNKQVFPPNARNSVLKSAQPLSNIVYYLFDQARNPDQK